jgi:hypothetical protein
MDMIRHESCDLLGAFEQVEIALEYALQAHQDACLELRQDQPAAGQHLETTLRTLLRLHDRRDHLRTEIARH